MPKIHHSQFLRVIWTIAVSPHGQGVCISVKYSPFWVSVVLAYEAKLIQKRHSCRSIISQRHQSKTYIKDIAHLD